MKIFFKNKLFFLALIFSNLINTKNLKKYSEEEYLSLKSSLSSINSHLFERNLKELNCFFLEKNEEKFKDLLKNNPENGSLIYLNKKNLEQYCVGYFCKKKKLFYIDPLSIKILTIDNSYIFNKTIYLSIINNPFFLKKKKSPVV